MTRYVVDANVIAKWFVEEELSGHADALLLDENQFAAPHFALAEVASVFRKKIRAGTLDTPHALDHLRGAVDVLEFVWSLRLLESALQLAIEHGVSLYDCLYVALALEQGCRLVTGDRRLYNSLRHRYGEHLLWLGDVPLSV